MAQQSDVPLICDDVPGPLSGYLVTRVPMTASEVDRIKRAWKELPCGPGPLSAAAVSIFDNRIVFEPIPEPRQWPDAEFCAA